MLKVGDYVKVKDQEFCILTRAWVESMNKYCGQIHKIRSVSSDRRYCELENCHAYYGHWYFHKDALIPLSDKLKEFLKNERI